MSEATKTPAEELAEVKREVESLRSDLAVVVALLRTGSPVPPHMLMHPDFILLLQRTGHERKARLRDWPTETKTDRWKHLVWRKHPWRQQLSLAGRNMTARQLVGKAKANRWSAEETATNCDLSVEAVREAFEYVHANAELLAFEATAERMMLEGKGAIHAARPVS